MQIYACIYLHVYINYYLYINICLSIDLLMDGCINLYMPVTAVLSILLLYRNPVMKIVIWFVKKKNCHHK